MQLCLLPIPGACDSSHRAMPLDGKVQSFPNKEAVCARGIGHCVLALKMSLLFLVTSSMCLLQLSTFGASNTSTCQNMKEKLSALATASSCCARCINY